MTREENMKGGLSKMNRISAILLVSLLVVGSAGFVFAEPNGADPVTAGADNSATATAAKWHNATAGNVTELVIEGFSVTQSWQGYYGNVSGAIRLGDSSGNVMYNWSLASPSGEVFASRSNSVAWSSIDCFNWTASGAALETAYNIDDAADGVNETFKDSNSHAAFYVGSEEFTSGECMSTDVFDDTGAVDGTFEEVLLHDGSDVVFASLLEDDVDGFDSNTHDFQMLVLEDGHEGNTDTTQYFFYIELE